MKRVGDDVLFFGDYVTEVICSPKDIAHFNAAFWTNHKPVTPAVRPSGLQGNTANDVNAFSVEKAIKAGSAGLIIGSPIMSAPNRRNAAELVIEQMAETQAA